MDPKIRSKEQLRTPSMNGSEGVVAERFREAGWRPYRHGWPDFLMVKDGRIKMIEVKSGQDKISVAQRRMHKMLRDAGIEVIVVRVDGDRAIRWNGRRTNIVEVPWSDLTD